MCSTKHEMVFKHPTPWEEFLTTPFLLTIIGSSLIFFGITIQLLSTIFLKEFSLAADWMSFWGMVLTCFGGILYSMSTFVNQSILVSIGGFFLTIGLMLFTAYYAWEVSDVTEQLQNNDLTEYQNHIERRGILGVVAMCSIFVAIYFFVKKSLQKLVKPFFGPANYLLYGSLTFGAGAFCFFLTNISVIKGVDVSRTSWRLYYLRLQL